MYATPSEDYISANLNSKALNYLLDTMCNISSVLGDTDGKVTITTATELTKSLDISANGLVLSNSEVIQDAPSSYLIEEYYAPEVAYDSYLTYLYMRSGDPNYVLSIIDSREITSPLLRLTREQHAPAYLTIRSLYLEAFSIYKGAVELKTVDSSQADKVITNCKVLASYLASKDKVNYDLLEVLKTLKLSLMFLKHYAHLLPEQEGY
jgi:dipeptidyl aminopeptidase/acylaminoacyl peptidase